MYEERCTFHTLGHIKYTHFSYTTVYTDVCNLNMGKNFVSENSKQGTVGWNRYKTTGERRIQCRSQLSKRNVDRLLKDESIMSSGVTLPLENG